MSGYAVYPEYRDSGVEWIGKIPRQWEVKPLFGIATAERKINLDGKETNVLSLSYGKIVRRDVDKNFGLLPESFNTYQIVQPGQLILRLTDLQNDKRSLRVGFVIESGIITSAYLKLAADQRSMQSLYFYYLLHAYDKVKVFYGMGGGLRQSMKFDDMRRLQLLAPPLNEQQKIANFLDHETAKIDTLIEKQQQLIKLLKEKRQAVISHAVTKGLNPDAPMKDSGVEWLGEVPEHWEIKKFSHVAVIRAGLVDPKIEPYKSYWLVAPNHIKSYEGKIHLLETAEEQGADSGKYLCQRGEVIYSKIRPALAKACLAPSDTTICSADMYPISCVSSMNNEFLLLLILTEQFTALAVNFADRVAMPKINRDALVEIKLPVPPIQEQIAISKAIAKEEENYLKLSESVKTAKILLKERRTALISAAVTGKIDVRNWQPPADTSTPSMDA